MIRENKGTDPRNRSVSLFLPMQIVGFLIRRLIYYFDIKIIHVFFSNFPSKLFILPCFMSSFNIKLKNRHLRHFVTNTVMQIITYIKILYNLKNCKHIIKLYRSIILMTLFMIIVHLSIIPYNPISYCLGLPRQIMYM